MKFFLLVVFVLFPLSASAQSIDKAYQKEFAYLQAQKAALTQRVAELERQNTTQTQQESGQLSAIQNRLIAAQLRADQLAEQLTEIDREAVRGDEHSEQLLSVFEQAKASLERYDVTVETPKQPTGEHIKALFVSAMRPLDEGGQIRTEPGTYFLADGTKANGEVTHVGRVAAFGDGLPLAPAGDGRLKVWRGQTGAGIFLFESTDKAVQEKVEPTWLETIEAGGLIAWVIVVLGAFALVLAAWRLIALFRASSRGEFADEVGRLVAVGRYAEAQRIADAASGATARVVSRTISVLDQRRKTADDAIAEAILAEQPAIDRFGTAIMVFAAVAPLLGLLGTVTGMIATFDIITEYGTGDPKMLSSGISEALITTQLGLMVAIPSLLVGNLLNAKAGSLIDGLEQAALRVLNAARADIAPPEVEPAPVTVDLAGSVLKGAS